MNPTVFREYDIRGLAEKDFDKDFALLLGRVHGAIVHDRGGRRVAVGRDCRFTSDAYAEAVIGGLLSAGLQVYDIGVCPTPLLYFSLFHLDLDGGVQITASHNPSEYNGFKVCVGKETIYGTQIQELRVKMEQGEFQDRPGGKQARYAIVPPYEERVLRDVPALARPLKVVVDAGSGVAGAVAPPIFRPLRRPGRGGRGAISGPGRRSRRKIGGATGPATPLPASTTTFRGRANAGTPRSPRSS